MVGSTPQPLSPHFTEIIERVTRGEQPPFRPSLALQSHLEELGQLMQRCWAEDPQERPPFQQIRLMLRKFNRSLALFVDPPLPLPPTDTIYPTLKSYPCSGRGSPLIAHLHSLLQPTRASQPPQEYCITQLSPVLPLIPLSSTNFTTPQPSYSALGPALSRQ